MRKPISKNSLRRAFEGALAEGQLQVNAPVNAVIDRIWHEMERENYTGGRKRAASRETVRTAPLAELTELE